MSSKEIQGGSRVVMHFRISLENGFVAEDTFAEEPMTFESGDGTLIPALDEFLIGLQAEDHGQLVLNPDQGFGFRDDANIHQISASDFADDISLAEGQIIGFVSPAGDEVPGTILSIEKDQLMVDFNHPFAGHVVTFDVKILSVT
ncbi:MAG: FKBP-type peptidyl-prolyl cis-trans isomerase [Gammaproteobacteria bacterium]|nr:FKBP-type peptidyl-prolyl cis-trans isomerase [Gammaproteobacteria bacterium]